MNHNIVAVIKCTGSRDYELETKWDVVMATDSLVSWYREYVGLLIAQHASVVAASHVAVCKQPSRDFSVCCFTTYSANVFHHNSSFALRPQRCTCPTSRARPSIRSSLHVSVLCHHSPAEKSSGVLFNRGQAAIQLIEPTRRGHSWTTCRLSNVNVTSIHLSAPVSELW